MRLRRDPVPRGGRRSWRAVRRWPGALRRWPQALRRLLVGEPVPGAPTWRHIAREASDARSWGEALARLMSAPADLLIGPEPPPLPPGGRRLGWLGRYRPMLLWLAAAGAFALSAQQLADDGRMWEVLVPPVALAMALPLVLAVDTPLRAWRVVAVLAVVAPVLLPSAIGWTSDGAPPWPPTLLFVGLYVLLAVALRVELHLLVGVWLVTGAVVYWSYLVSGPRPNPITQANVAVVLLTILIAYGYLVGTRRRLQRELAEGRRREQQEQVRSALLEERARIARELHDVVAHHMSVIAVRAETAPFRIPGLPEPVKDDMAETSAIAREALAEMRRLLGVLRGTDATAELAPQPGMDRLEGLVAAVRGAGLAVDLQVVGEQRPLPSGVELSAYRILQEALSNALWHAPGAQVSIEVGYEPDRLRLRVHNDPPPDPGDRPRPSTPGHGLIGMRERVAMLGGTLVAEPGEQGDYLVEAVLPLDAGHRPEAAT